MTYPNFTEPQIGRDNSYIAISKFKNKIYVNVTGYIVEPPEAEEKKWNNILLFMECDEGIYVGILAQLLELLFKNK